MRRERTLVLVVALAACTHDGTSAARAQPTARIDDGPPPEIEGDHNLLHNGGFADGSYSPWRVTLQAGATGTAAVQDGAMCLSLTDAAKAGWDVQLRHRAIALVPEHRYLVEFVAWSDRPTRARPRIGRAGPPYEEYWAAEVELGPRKQRYRGHFEQRAGADDAAEFTFQLGGPLAGKGAARVCFDEITLADPLYTPPPPPTWASAPKIRVNQLGYFPRREKRATYKTAATSPQPWALHDAAGHVVAEGQTEVFGEDRSSGDAVHRIDFSGFTQSGKDYRLHVGADSSDGFAIDDDLYLRLRRDALAYFYYNRSGIAIEMPYAGNPRWTRGVGQGDCI
jgi:endoglucanase